LKSRKKENHTTYIFKNWAMSHILVILIYLIVYYKNNLSRSSSSSTEEERREGSEDQYAAWYVFIVKFNKENTEHCNIDNHPPTNSATQAT
jgi:hypothetical protein